MLTVKEVQELHSATFSAAPGTPTIQAVVRLQSRASEIADLVSSLHTQFQMYHEALEAIVAGGEMAEQVGAGNSYTAAMRRIANTALAQTEATP